MRGRTLAVVLVLAASAGCASGPTVDDAQDLLASGDAESALAAIHEAERGPLDAETAHRARRIAFDASLALGLSDEAAREFLVLRVPARDRERLRERLAGGTLKAAFSSPDGGRRAIAASELALSSAHPKVLLLEDLALADREPIVRLVALGSLARLADTETVVRRLEQALADPDEDVRGAAAESLAARLGPPRAGEPSELAAARAALARAHTNALAPAERLGADLDAGRRAWLAADRSQPRSVEALKAVLAGRDPALAPEAARLLGERGGSAAVRPLVAALADGSSPARIAAAHALGALGGPEATAALLSALARPEGTIRRAAAEGLARSGNASALDELSRAIADPREDSDLAAAAAVLAIEARTGLGAASSAPTTQEGP